MTFSTHFNSGWLNKILTSPDGTYRSYYYNEPYSARVAIPHYRKKVLSHYGDIIRGDLNRFCQNADIPQLESEHYGIIIQFDQAVMLSLHDENMELNNSLKELIKQMGAVIIKNVYMGLEYRNRCHRASFPQLNFHVDRTIARPTHYSMYSRDPFDDEQKFPRTASTLFIPSVTAHLQAVKENKIRPDEKGMKPSYNLFSEESMEELRDNIILEHSWNEPEGTGELSMLDNLTAMHSSYYHNPHAKGYKIGVRYLA